MIYLKITLMDLVLIEACVIFRFHSIQKFNILHSKWHCLGIIVQ